MKGLRRYAGIILVFLLTSQICYSVVIVRLTIESYSNPNGTAYKDSSNDRKCCDGPQRASCQIGDTCDTYFDICVGSLTPKGGCVGASFHTVPAKDTNNISNVPAMESKSNTWQLGSSIFVFINDDDSQGTASHDHIDTLIQEVRFSPVPTHADETPHQFEWLGKTSLTLNLTAWCDIDYYGGDCSVYCRGLEPMAWCSSTGKLTCSQSDEVLIEFRKNTSSADLPMLTFALKSFVREQVCVGANASVQYTKLDLVSNTLAFTANCGNNVVSAFQLESLLNEKSEAQLNLYFEPGVVRGKDVSIHPDNEHIVPNVYVGVEVVSASHPAGTSFYGNSTTGARRCCDVPGNDSCQVAKDTCDLQFFVCIGKICTICLSNNLEFDQTPSYSVSEQAPSCLQRLIGDKCVGAATVSSVFEDTTSLETCGPTLLDYNQGRAYVSHPMIGVMRLTQRMADVQVIVKDSDRGGNSSDVIDIVGGLVLISPGSDVTNATSEDIPMKHVVSIKLRVIFWCAPGHAGPLCTANNGTDLCYPGWHGDDCSIPTTACSSNPCKNSAVCRSSPDGSFMCVCTEGYNGTLCDDDIDECALHVCQHGATCQNLPGAFNCECPSGWDGLICTDIIPECSPSPCQHGICQRRSSTGTNYTCSCLPGWSGTNCSQKVICTDPSCVNGKCVIVAGNPFCLCDPGYKGENCTEDIDECEAKPCKLEAPCANTIGSFSCTCPDGYGGQTCDIPRTSCPMSQCNDHGFCDLIGKGPGYVCDCLYGFAGTNCEKVNNACNSVTCLHNGVCIDMSDDFRCNCSKFWSGKVCDVDVNECKMLPCQNGAQCTNTPGSYTCACPAGWAGTNCSSDVDECQQRKCKYGTCSNTPGSYKCVCNEGYSGPHCTFKSVFCKNVTCSGRGKCIEQMYRYQCQCNTGYNGNNCELDVDECSFNICKNYATACLNSPGSYNCTCATGWTGSDCSVDVNECKVTAPFPCSGNGICHNTIGSFKCQCFDGFIGSTCDVIVNDCKDLKCMNNGTCLTGNDGPKCTCAKGWQGIRCGTDTNECEEDSPCFNYGECVNTEGSFYCNCYIGWTGNTCETDVDECLAPTCQHGGVCTNLIGSFECSCKHEWQGMRCEVQLTNSLTGSVLELIFKQNISSTQTTTVLSDLYQFLTRYVCNTQTPAMNAENVGKYSVRFQASCPNGTVTQAWFQSGLQMVPNITRQYLFPVALQEIQTVYIPGDSNSWISSNWPILAGVFAALLVVVAVAVGCYRKRKNKKAEPATFSNPEYSEYSGDRNDLISAT